MGESGGDEGERSHRPEDVGVAKNAGVAQDNEELGADQNQESSEGKDGHDPMTSTFEGEQTNVGPGQSGDVGVEGGWDETAGKGGDETVAAPLSLSLLNSVLSPLVSVFPTSPSLPLWSSSSPRGREEVWTKSQQNGLHGTVVDGDSNMAEAEKGGEESGEGGLSERGGKEENDSGGRNVQQESQSVKRLTDQNLKLSVQLTDCSISLRKEQLDNMELRRLLGSERAKQKILEDELKRLDGIATLRAKTIENLVQLCRRRRSREVQRCAWCSMARAVQMSKDARQREMHKNLDTQLQLRDYMAQRLQLLTGRLLRRIFRNLLYVSFVHFCKHMAASLRRRARAKKADIRHRRISLERAWIFYFAAVELRYLKRQNVLKRLRRFHLQVARRILRCWRKLTFQAHQLHYHRLQNLPVSGHYGARDAACAHRETLGAEWRETFGEQQVRSATGHVLPREREGELEAKLRQECEALARERDVLQRQLLAERETLEKLEKENTALSSSALEHLDWIELEYKAHQKQTNSDMIHWQIEQWQKHTQRHLLHLKLTALKALEKNVVFHRWLRRKTSRNTNLRIFRNFCRAVSEQHNECVERSLLQVREQLDNTKKMLLLALEHQASSPQSRSVSPQSTQHFLSFLDSSLSFGPQIARTLVGEHVGESRHLRTPQNGGSAEKMAKSTAQSHSDKSPIGIVPFVTTPGGTPINFDFKSERRSVSGAFTKPGDDDVSEIRADTAAAAGGPRAQLGFGSAPQVSPIHPPRHPVACEKKLGLPGTSAVPHRWASLLDSPTSSPQAQRKPLSIVGREEGKGHAGGGGGGEGEGRGPPDGDHDHEEERQSDSDSVECEEEEDSSVCHADGAHPGNEGEEQRLAWTETKIRASQEKSESNIDQWVVQRCGFLWVSASVCCFCHFQSI